MNIGLLQKENLVGGNAAVQNNELTRFEVCVTKDGKSKVEITVVLGHCLVVEKVEEDVQPAEEEDEEDEEESDSEGEEENFKI